VCRKLTAFGMQQQLEFSFGTDAAMALLTDTYLFVGFEQRAAGSVSRQDMKSNFGSGL